tara:strand:- start:69 stop:542 length:474 start_codon:yes stop_codon:yes gene_type:complete
MIINHDLDKSMKLVCDLKERLKVDAKQVELAQALTLNPDKPLLGLKGSLGLFGSHEWWESIEKGVMPVCIMQGAIVRAYVAGKDRNGSSPNDMIEVLLEDGSVCHDGIYTNDKSDVRLFVPGARVALAYIYDELKAQSASDGGINYARVVLEMAVSI